MPAGGYPSDDWQFPSSTVTHSQTNGLCGSRPFTRLYLPQQPFAPWISGSVWEQKGKEIKDQDRQRLAKPYHYQLSEDSSAVSLLISAEQRVSASQVSFITTGCLADISSPGRSQCWELFSENKQKFGECMRGLKSVQEAIMIGTEGLAFKVESTSGENKSRNQSQ